VIVRGVGRRSGTAWIEREKQESEKGARREDDIESKDKGGNGGRNELPFLLHSFSLTL